MTEINPFYSLSRAISETYRKGARVNRDAAAFHNMQTALAMHHAQNESITKQTEQEASLNETAKNNAHSRATEFFGTVHTHAQPGKPVSIKHGDIEASYTPAASKTPSAPKLETSTAPQTSAAPKSRRGVPVKRNRGGKKIR